ncbi:ribokinase-like isoform X2 [Punica granatum]|uniref:Ribokinase-like isoform X2 n=1 Tax=Punica granatum TaxID=22663 RepID=A0A6P8BQ81_PUNGR|nr:ribokinase-like isoform X2 [Punica granatum]
MTAMTSPHSHVNSISTLLFTPISPRPRHGFQSLRRGQTQGKRSHLLHSTSSSCSTLSFGFWNSFRLRMSSEPLPPLPERRIVVGLGMLSVDFLATVASFPKPDDKIRSTSLKVQGGGNSGNALTCVARLGLSPRLISKVADDSQGQSIIEELEADGVDTSYIVVSKEGNSPFTYLIIDEQTKTRTCIHQPGYPLAPDEVSSSNLLSALDGARILYFDGRFPDTALEVAKEATSRNIPILIDAERLREGLDDLLDLADYAVCSAKFPQAWTEAPSIPTALLSMLLRLPKLKFVIVTLGEEGCVMLERTSDDPQLEEVDVDNLLDLLKQRKDDGAMVPTCVSSAITKLRADGIGTVTGRLILGTAEKIPPSELVDTTGAGDAFIGATIYAICAEMPPEKMLPFAAQVVIERKSCTQRLIKNGLFNSCLWLLNQFGCHFTSGCCQLSSFRGSGWSSPAIGPTHGTLFKLKLLKVTRFNYTRTGQSKGSPDGHKATYLSMHRPLERNKIK